MQEFQVKEIPTVAEELKKMGYEDLEFDELSMSTIRMFATTAEMKEKYPRDSDSCRGDKECWKQR